MSLPDKCPFCGAAIAIGEDGKKRVADLIVIFDCGSGFDELIDPIRTRSRACKAITRVAELEARCKRLEEAGDNLDSSIACGCGVDGPCQMCRRASDSWQQAKEARP